MDTESESIWNGFTNLYSLTKTLRFELQPIGADGKPLSTEEAKKRFESILKIDTEIKESYRALKPVLDRVHENVINESLSSKEAEEIDFSGYYEEYKKEYKTKDIKERAKIEKELRKIEKKLRKKIVEVYKVGAQKIVSESNKNNSGKSIFKKSDINILKEKGILIYIENNAKNFDSILKESEIKFHLSRFKNFFTYFQGYNQNRMNYYTDEKKTTAIATRIVNDNLPKFCDNCIQFSNAGDSYLKVCQEIEDEIFQISKFSKFLLQSGIDKYNIKIGNYNQSINLYNNQRKSAGAKKLELFKTLHKQIGCGKKKPLFYALEYDTPEDQKKEGKTEEIRNLKCVLSEIARIGNKYFVEKSNTNFIDWLKQVKNWQGIYWSKDVIEKISSEYFYNWEAIHDILENYLKDKSTKNKYKAVALYNKKSLKINNAVELAGLFEILDRVNDGNEGIFKKSILEDTDMNKKPLINKDLKPSENLISLICNKLEGLSKDFQSRSESIMKITDYKKEDKIKEIKEWLDTSLKIIRVIKYFDVKEEEVKGVAINLELTNLISAILYSDDSEWFKWYNAIRNYLTKKPQDDVKKNKLKLNFGYPNFLDGWSDGQEKNKGGVLLRKDGKYYVGILCDRTIFNTGTKDNPIYEDKQDGERFIIKILKFKTLVGKGYKSKYQETYSKQMERNPQDAFNNVKGYIKEKYINHYPKLEKILRKTYKDKEEFTKHVIEVLKEYYECKPKKIDWSFVLQNVASQKIHLFKIYTKDFSNKSSGKPNLQTKYWEHIFQSNTTIQLNSGAEIFFRDKAIYGDKIFHPANKSIYRRSDGKTASKFSHDIIKDKRFTNPKYLFHVPIKINYKAQTQNYKEINENINKNLIGKEEIRFLGIDRGEKHLIYYSLVDSKGNIIKQGNFDKINKKNYLEEIDNAAKLRREKQENWQQKGIISNLKDGYISLVIHNIIEKMRDLKTGEFIPTFIVLENLNKEFKRSRQKFESQVYQKFELALAKKLNYLVDKNLSEGNVGSVAKALQLTPPVNNYQDIENKTQFGIMLYVSPKYTSITDPVTGWRKTIHFKGSTKEDIKENILKTFSKIEVDENGDYSFEYKDGNGKVWTLWSSKSGKSLERYYFKKVKNTNNWVSTPYNAKEELDKLFKNFDKKKLISEQLKEYEDQSSWWESLLDAINKIQNIRNSGDPNKNQAENFLLSPVRDQNGDHFDTRTQSSKEPLLPDNADANGAYNIARKGIIMYNHIKKCIQNNEIESKKSVAPNLFISDKEWDLWTTNRQQWEKELETFAFKKSKHEE